METPGMEFTGERLVPGVDGLEELYTEHMSRYLLASLLAGDKRVLDVGCGCGYGTHLIAAAGAREVVGIDISREAIDFANSRYSRDGLVYRVMNARRLGLDGRFGLVTCFELIEHVAEDREVVVSIAALLEEQGVCLISTPNARTYVAGGDGGDNPYHCREYDVEEFEVLLRTAFGGVTMLEQRWTDGILISPPSTPAGAGGEQGAAALLPDEKGTRPEPASYGPAPYFVAACTLSASAELPPALLQPFSAVTASTRYRKLKEEFDQRGRWARSLDEELRAKDEAIGRLREEKAKLEKEFDERGRWAQDLDREVREKSEMINRLMAENEQLRRAAAMTNR
jgi:SAM-dependent methyltransferase